MQALGGKIVLHYLPPYSPDFNPIERVWWDLHAAVTRTTAILIYPAFWPPSMATLRTTTRTEVPMQARRDWRREIAVQDRGDVV